LKPDLLRTRLRLTVNEAPLAGVSLAGRICVSAMSEMKGEARRKCNHSMQSSKRCVLLF
jgi:hypothetical protein